MSTQKRTLFFLTVTVIVSLLLAACQPAKTAEPVPSPRPQPEKNIIEFNRAVKVDGLGTFSPSIDLDGNLAISYRPDPALSNGLNIPGIFSGTISNRENIGKTSEELAQKWNAANPGDPVTAG